MSEIKKSLKSGKQPINCNGKELSYALSPFGKADYKAGLENPEKNKVIRKGYKICDICNKEYSTRHTGAHKKTQYHQLHLEMNNKIKKLIFNE